MCQVLKHLYFQREAHGRSLEEGSWERCCLVPGFLLTVKAEGIGDLTAKKPSMGCPGLWQYTAEPSWKTLTVSRVGLMFHVPNLTQMGQ